MALGSPADALAVRIQVSTKSEGLMMNERKFYGIVITQASVHSNPTSGNEYKVVNWLRQL